MTPMPIKPLSSGELTRLLLRRTSAGAEALDRRITARTQTDLAVLVADSSGFTRQVLDTGVLPFLARMHRCYRKVVPLLERGGGRVLSQRADNILAVYPDALAAVKAARRAQQFLRKDNAKRPPSDRFHLCMGIDAGPVLALSDDVFGAAVNIASKLGEDLAEKNEILLTGEVVRRLAGRLRSSYARSTQIGGRLFELHRCAP